MDCAKIWRKRTFFCLLRFLFRMCSCARQLLIWINSDDRMDGWWKHWRRSGFILWGEGNNFELMLNLKWIFPAGWKVIKRVIYIHNFCLLLRHPIHLPFPYSPIATFPSFFADRHLHSPPLNKPILHLFLEKRTRIVGSGWTAWGQKKIPPTPKFGLLIEQARAKGEERGIVHQRGDKADEAVESLTGLINVLRAATRHPSPLPFWAPAIHPAI